MQSLNLTKIKQFKLPLRKLIFVFSKTSKELLEKNHHNRQTIHIF